MKTIVCDTRQQMRNVSHRRKEEYFTERGYNILHSKLPCGDYAMLDNMSVVVDSKDGLAEVVNNVCGVEHERFRRECILAKQNGIKLYILIEEDQTDESGHYVVNRLGDVHKWQNPRRKIKVKDSTGKWVPKYPKATTGAVLKKAMITMMYRYSVTWVFCRKKEAGAKIIELLTRKEEEWNENEQNSTRKNLGDRLSQ